MVKSKREKEHIVISEKLKKFLDEKKVHNREPYNDVLARLLKLKEGE